MLAWSDWDSWHEERGGAEKTRRNAVAMRPRVEVRFREVQLPADTSQPVEMAVVLTDRLRFVFALKRDEERGGWFVTVDGEETNEAAFYSAAEAHNAACEMVISSLPRLTKELTRALDKQEWAREERGG